MKKITNDKPEAVAAAATTHDDASTPVLAAEIEAQRKAAAKLAPPKGEEIDGGDVDEVWKLDAGDFLEGEYRGFKKTRGKKPTDVNQLHKFIVGKQRIGVFGTLQLNGMLERVGTGDTVWLGYYGKENLPNGNTMHNWKCVVTLRAGQPPF